MVNSKFYNAVMSLTNHNPVVIFIGKNYRIMQMVEKPVQKMLKHVDDENRFHTFNMGIGWVVIVSPDQAEAACAAGPGGTVLGTVGTTKGVRVKLKA